jgi:hypothetical protein
MPLDQAERRALRDLDVFAPVFHFAAPFLAPRRKQCKPEAGLTPGNCTRAKKVPLPIAQFARATRHDEQVAP